MLLIEHVSNSVRRRLVRDPFPTASTDELWIRIQTIENVLSLADIENPFHSTPCHLITFIEACGGYTKY